MSALDEQIVRPTLAETSPLIGLLSSHVAAGGGALRRVVSDALLSTDAIDAADVASLVDGDAPQLGRWMATWTSGLGNMLRASAAAALVEEDEEEVTLFDANDATALGLFAAIVGPCFRAAVDGLPSADEPLCDLMTSNVNEDVELEDTTFERWRRF